MPTNFPTALDSLTNPNTTDPKNAPSHAGQHSDANDAIEALEAKVGINGSADTDSHDYKLSEVENLIGSLSANNVAALSALSLGDGSVVTLKGYNAPGDGGGQGLIYHSTGRSGITIDDGFYFAGPGADDYYEAIDKSVANANRFGAFGDGNILTDEHARLQACIDTAESLKVNVFIPDGDYSIDSTLWLSGTASSTEDTNFRGSITITGGGGQTIITSTFKDRPATAVQMARAVRIRDLIIVGTNDAPQTQESILSRDYANWIDGDMRDSRYSPQCGFAIDPILGPTPPDGGYPGMTYVGKANGGSNDITLENVRLQRHVVGLCVRPDGLADQVDDITLDRVYFHINATGLAICNSQTRSSSTAKTCNWFACHTAVDTIMYGQQQGCPMNIKGAHLRSCYRLLKMNDQFGSLDIAGMYAEGLREIGIIGSGVSGHKMSVNFSGGFFVFNSDGFAPRPAFVVSSQAPLTFVGTQFAFDNGGVASDVINFQGSRIRCVGVSFAGDNASTVKHIGVSISGSTGVQLVNCGKYKSGGFAWAGLPEGGDVLQSYGTRLEPHHSTRFAWNDAGHYIYTPGSNSPFVADAISNESFTATTLTFDATDVTKFQVGDYLMATCTPLDGATSAIVPALKVTAIDGVTVTAEAFVDPAEISDPTPSNQALIAILQWAPAVALTGTTTSASPTITSVSPTTIIQVGDWIKGAAGIPTNARVVSINTGAATVTLNKNATASGSTSLYWGQVNSIALLGSLGTMATQNSNAVVITGGTTSGMSSIVGEILNATNVVQTAGVSRLDSGGSFINLGGVLRLWASGSGSFLFRSSSDVTIMTLNGATGDLTLTGHLTMADAKNLVANATTGTKIGTATTQKLGFWNATPVVQPAANPDTSGATLGGLETEVNQLKALLRTIGLMAP